MMLHQNLRQIKFSWRRISQSEIRNSAAAESEGGQKFLPPNPLPFCPPEHSVWRAKRAVSSVQKRFAQSQILVRGRGLEPPRPCGHMHLKHAWLPLQHPRVTPRRRFFGGFFSWKDFSKNTFLSGELFWANLKC